MTQISIAFLGATDTVTGSRFLITSPKSRVLIDCGMFQGAQEIRRKNWQPFPVDISTIDAVILSHAHLDHSGYLPLLVKQGYRNPVFATHYTKSLAAIILHDSAHLQSVDAQYAAENKYSENKHSRPLYEETDVNTALALFREVRFHLRTKVCDDVFVTFYPSGHILGSSFLVVEVGAKKFLFTSDLGRDNHPLLSPPDRPPNVDIDVVVTESTYGDRLHETPASVFADEINAGIDRGGMILIPAFAVDRTEVILMALRDLIKEQKIPPIPIYIDSPMALQAIDQYRHALDARSPEIRSGIGSNMNGHDIFDAGSLVELATAEESMALKKIRGTGVIISSSGMGSGGRVVHHLKNLLPHSKNTVILVGFQAAGTRGRQLEEGHKEVRIHGEWIPVKAHIVRVEIFSVHADSNELVQWLSHIRKPQQAFVVHGETDAQLALKMRLEDELHWHATVPKSAQVFEV